MAGGVPSGSGVASDAGVSGISRSTSGTKLTNQHLPYLISSRKNPAYFSRKRAKLSMTISPVVSFTLGISSTLTPVGPRLGL